MNKFGPSKRERSSLVFYVICRVGARDILFATRMIVALHLGSMNGDSEYGVISSILKT